jgi:hypothetical protein
MKEKTKCSYPDCKNKPEYHVREDLKKKVEKLGRKAFITYIDGQKLCGEGYETKIWVQRDIETILADVLEWQKEEKQKLKPHKIICLVGTTKPVFQEQYRKVNRELCLAGYLVVTVSLFKNDVDNIEKYRDLLESIHFQKIRLSHAVVLIHKDAIGEHTAMEIEYCKNIGKPIVTFSNIKQTEKELEEVLK